MCRIFFIFFILFSPFTQAHQLKENYLHATYDDTNQSLSMKIEIETRLFEEHYLLDDNDNGIVSFKELYSHQTQLFDYLQKHFRLLHHNTPLALEHTLISFHRYQDQTYMQVEQNLTNITLNTLTLHYSMFFELEDTHKLLIHLNDLRGDAILTHTQRVYHFSDLHLTQMKRLSLFIHEGFGHILDGIDHLLFILMLMIATMAEKNTAQKNRLLKKKIIFLLKIITTFSLAHSLTLFIASSGLYIPSVKLIESGIALSVFITALLNLLGYYRHITILVVSVFGLLHGFGFANVLNIINTDEPLSFIVALLGFNLGVEIGQIFMIILTLPLLLLLLKSRYHLYLIQSIAFSVAIIALLWFIERIGLF